MIITHHDTLVSPPNLDVSFGPLHNSSHAASDILIPYKFASFLAIVLLSLCSRLCCVISLSTYNSPCSVIFSFITFLPSHLPYYSPSLSITNHLTSLDMRFDHFQAWITLEGNPNPLPEFNIKVERNTITCFIPSEMGKVGVPLYLPTTALLKQMDSASQSTGATMEAEYAPLRTLTWTARSPRESS